LPFRGETAHGLPGPAQSVFLTYWPKAVSGSATLAKNVKHGDKTKSADADNAISLLNNIVAPFS